MQYYGGKKDEDIEGMRSESWGSFPGGMGGYERLRVKDRVPAL